MKEEIELYKRINHGVSEEVPIVIKHDIWDKIGCGLLDMHYEVELGIVCSGKMRRKHGDCTQDFQTGDIWMSGIWEPHSAEVLNAPLELLIFHIHPPMLAYLSFPEDNNINWLNLFTRSPKLRFTQEYKDKNLYLNIAKSVIELNKDCSVFSKLKIHNLFMQLLISIAETSTHSESEIIPSDLTNYAKINRVIESIFNSKKGLSFNEAVNIAGINKTSFAKSFKNLMGISFAKFALRYRLGRVAKDLKKTDEPIKIIADEWGFTDDSHLHKNFEKHYNMTPTQYRNI